MRIPGREPLLPVLLLGAALLVLAIGIVQDQLEEIPQIPYELAEYAGVTLGDLGTARLLDDPARLVVRLPAKRPGRVRFLVAGDGGGEHDPGKRALARRMRELCRAEPCDFILFTGDNVYPNGVETFGELAREALPEVDLQTRFLGDRRPEERARLRSRVRALAGLVARSCGGATASSATQHAAAAGLSDAAAVASRSGAAEARRRHFEPRFERTFSWLAEERVPAFLLLGNHDWRSPFGTECEIGRSLAEGTAWRLPFYFYRIEIADPTSGAPMADLLALYSAPPHGSPHGENHARIGPRQRAWLRDALSSSRARWRLTASHHPVWSAGGHTLLEYLSFHRDLLAELSRAAGRTDLLLAGHNHWLESVTVPLSDSAAPALQVVAGSFSKVAFGRMFLRGYPFVDALALQPLWRLAMSEQLETDPSAFLRRDRSVLARGFALIELEEGGGSVRFFGTEGELFADSLPRTASASRSILPSGNAASASNATQR